MVLTEMGIHIHCKFFKYNRPPNKIFTAANISALRTTLTHLHSVTSIGSDGLFMLVQCYNCIAN